MHKGRPAPQQAQYFSPWQDEPELLPPSPSPDPIPPPPKPTLRHLRFRPRDQDLILEDSAKKNLLQTGSLQKETGFQFREFSQLQGEQKMPRARLEFKLPLIGSRAKVIGSRSQPQRSSSNVEHKDNSEQVHHHRGLSLRQGQQRSISFQLHGALPRTPSKMHTIEMTRQLPKLRLKGQKVEWQSRGRVGRAGESYSYLPTQPNITPYHELVGHCRQQVFKKVFSQILHLRPK